MRIRVGLFVVAAALATSVSVQALSYVYVDDLALTQQADVIARVEVVDSRVVTQGRRIHTEYTMLIRDLVKGFVDGTYLTVEVPGGSSEELDLVLEYHGAPRFATGSRALLFLNPNESDDSFHVLHFVLGAFREITNVGSEVFVRDIPEPATAGERPLDVGREAERFIDWIRSIETGERPTADYFVALTKEARSRVAEPFTVRSLTYVLWQEFLVGQKVTFKRHKIGQDGVPKGGKSELKKVFKDLNNTPNSTGTGADLVNLALKGKFSTKKVPDILNTCPAQNSIIFDDASGIRTDFNCNVGGVIATGGSCRSRSPSGPYKDGQLFRAGAGFVSFNANTRCFFENFGSDTAKNKFLEVTLHEILHVLGLGHACGDDDSPKCSKSAELADATMAAIVHADGRANQMRDDDLSGFWQLYDPEYFNVGCDVEPGNKKFCKRCGPCGEGQGKCTKNKHCFGDLKCRNDATLGFKTCQP